MLYFFVKFYFLLLRTYRTWYIISLYGGKNMRLKITRTKSDTNYYIIKDITKNGKRTTQIYEKLGNIEQITKHATGEESLDWINKY